jgi:hypothetical protein
MALGAVLAIFVGVLVGVLLLAELSAGGGLRWIAAAHVTLAVVATAIVCGAAFTASTALAWVAVGAVLAAGSAGLVTWRRSVAPMSAAGSATPPVLLVAHGAAAVLALLLVVLAAARH